MDNKVKVGAAIGAVVLIVVVLLFIFVIPKSDSCKLQDDKPKLDTSKVTNHKTKDNKSMANFLGYLIYQKNTGTKNNSTAKQTYLELDLNSIKQSGSLNGAKPAKLKLKTSCCDITIVLPVVDKRVLFYFELDDISSDGDKAACTIANQMPLGLDQYYSCQRPIVYQCLEARDKQLVAELYVERLEFEVDGSPDDIKKEKFSKKRRDC